VTESLRLIVDGVELQTGIEQKSGWLVGFNFRPFEQKSASPRKGVC
jgi:hypothetical protein